MGGSRGGRELHQSTKTTHRFILIYNSVFDDVSYFYLQVRMEPSVTSDPTDTSSRGFTETQALTPRKQEWPGKNWL